MQCVCIILNVDQQLARKPADDGKYHTDWWKTAIVSSSVFANNKLAENLSGFSPEGLTPNIIASLA
jgi:hypothetical protein